MDNNRIAEILETSPKDVADKLEAFSRAKRHTERVFAVQYIKYKNADGVQYSVEDARQMTLASESYDEAKAREISAEAAYVEARDRQINVRKQSELLKQGI